MIDQVDNPADSSTQFKDVERSRAIGAEIGLKFRFSTDLLGNISYCYQYARDDVTKLQLSNSPLNLLKFSIATTLLQPFSLGFE